MLALATALSYVKIFKMPFGGSVTLASMAPICFASIVCGANWGVTTAFCYSWIQILQGEVFSWGLTPTMLLGSVFLDYIIAFSVIGLAGIFRKKGIRGCIFGTVLVCALRFISHFLAGFILWANISEFVAFGSNWVNKPVLYSLCYNGAFMLPELTLTVLVMSILLSIPQIRRLMNITN